MLYLELFLLLSSGIFVSFPVNKKSFSSIIDLFSIKYSYNKMETTFLTLWHYTIITTGQVLTIFLVVCAV